GPAGEHRLCGAVLHRQRLRDGCLSTGGWWADRVRPRFGVRRPAMVVAEVILLFVSAYLGCGLVVGVPFILRGVGRVDEAARGASLGFRLLILPGTVALWPL